MPQMDKFVTLDLEDIQVARDLKVILVQKGNQAEMGSQAILAPLGHQGMYSWFR